MNDQIDVNYLADALNNKMDIDLHNAPNNIDYVIESKKPTSDDPTWYRVYKSGWVEQGGKIKSNVTTITLLHTMSDNNYNCIVIYEKTTNTTTAQLNKFSTATQSITNFTVTSSSEGRLWQVSGQGA